MSNKKSHIFVISGPSGAGKSSIIEMFLKEDKDGFFSVSCTTRKKRDYEVDGKDYYFITESLFREMIEKDLFIEWEEVHGDFYGTLKEPLLKAKAEGKDIYLDVDVKGALNIKRVCKDAILIFIMPPSKEVLFQRLKKRGEREIEKRLSRFEREVEKSKEFDYIIFNDNLEEAYHRFKEFVWKIRREKHGKDHS